MAELTKKEKKELYDYLVNYINEQGYNFSEEEINELYEKNILDGNYDEEFGISGIMAWMRFTAKAHKGWMECLEKIKNEKNFYD